MTAVTTADGLDRDLRFVIEHKRLLQVTYSSKARLVEPHDYGMQKGVDRLLAYQLEGASNRRGPEWRIFDIAKIESWTVLDRTFPGSRGSAHPRHKGWDAVYARVR